VSGHLPDYEVHNSAGQYAFLVPGAEGSDHRQVFVEKALPAAEDYKPQFLLVSAGFDAHRMDPLAPLNLETVHYEWMTRWLTGVARRHCDGRLVSVLEGGYNLDALGASASEHLSLLLDYDGAGASPGHENGVW
jgi:acetoin utilization deacetylase AcuC-like enzyme